MYTPIKIKLNDIIRTKELYEILKYVKYLLYRCNNKKLHAINWSLLSTFV